MFHPKLGQARIRTFETLPCACGFRNGSTFARDMYTALGSPFMAMAETTEARCAVGSRLSFCHSHRPEYRC